MFPMEIVESDAQNTFWQREARALLCLGITATVQAIFVVGVIYFAHAQVTSSTVTTLRPSMPRPELVPLDTPSPSIATSVTTFTVAPFTVAPF